MVSESEASGSLYELMSEPRSDYLYISIRSENPEFEMSKPVWGEIAEACSNDKCEKILIQADVPQSLSIADLHWLRREFSKTGILDCRIAVADRRKRQILNRFAAIASANRGIVIRVFPTADAAEEWLDRGGKPFG